MSKLQRASRAVTGRITKIMVYILIVIVVIFFAQRSFAIGREVFSEEGVEPEPGTYLTVTILPDDSVGDIADKLLEVGLIRNKLVFYVQSFCFSLDVNEENAGAYRFNTAQSGEEIIGQITDGDYNVDEDQGTDDNE